MINSIIFPIFKKKKFFEGGYPQKFHFDGFNNLKGETFQLEIDLYYFLYYIIIIY